MNLKANTALLSCLLLAAPSLFADHDKGKKEEKRDDQGKIERKVKVDRDENHVRIERRERDDENENENEKKIQPTIVQTRIVRVNNDVNRLESILATTQNSAIAFPQPTLTRVANEANALANRIFANARRIRRPGAAATARELRMQVREMHAAAARGDAAAVRLHAGQALNFAVRLDGMV
jgi:hypothetical protein